MKNVYVVRFEGLSVYSTARKAIESLADSGLQAYTEPESWTIQQILDNNEACYTPITTENVPKLITWLNKHGFLHVYDGGDTVEISKEPVM